eukprot:6214102-Pleurochrysis_carterae.AAC.1
MSAAFTVSTLRKCAALVFGNSILDGEKPSHPKRAATHVWFGLVSQCRVVNFDGVVERIDYSVDGRRICCGAFAAVYAIPPNTFKALERNAKRGNYRWTMYAETRTTKKASEKLLAEAEVCVWSEVYKKGSIPQMRQVGYYWSLEKGLEESYATWRAGRAKALLCLSKETYGTEYPKPFRLTSRADHSAFKECSECKCLRLEVAQLLRDGADLAVVSAKKPSSKCTLTGSCGNDVSLMR